MTLSRLAAFAVLVLALLSLGTRLWLSMAESGAGQAIWNLLRYFTILTNLIVAASFARLAVGGTVRGPWIAGVTLWIVIVGVVYHVLLGQDLAGLEFWVDAGLHTAVPLAVALWWIAFAPKAGLEWHHAALWPIWPMIYLTYALTRGLVEGMYPYFFTDPAQVGWIGVLGWALALWVAFMLAGLGLVALSRLGRPEGRP